MSRKVIMVAIVLALIGGLIWWFTMRQGADNAALVNGSGTQQMSPVSTETATGTAEA